MKQSIASTVSTINIDEVVSFQNDYMVVAATISSLKNKTEHKEKKFKIRAEKNQTFVTRVK